jgi:MarR family transcriptional regulator, organic hydroperoxide resistance regulator
MSNKFRSSPFGFEQPEDSPGFLLWQTTMMWQRLIKNALEPFGVSHSQFVIMAILMWFEKHEYDAVQVSIVQWSKLDKMTVSLALKKLAAQRLIKRAEHKLDTRAKRVALTDKGKVLIGKLVPLVESIDAHFFGTITKKDEQLLITLLRKLTVNDEA